MPLSSRRCPKIVLVAAGAIVLALVNPEPAQAADPAELMKSKNCTACHAIDKKLIGPSYKDVASKYEGDKEAQSRLAKKIRDGGTGVWGQIPMPPNPQVSEEEAIALSQWVLTQK